MTLLQTTFIEPETRTICDLVDMPLPDGTPAYMVTRVNTPRQARGGGHASRLMREVVLPRADSEGATLFLDIVPTGGLTYGQLATWYHRLGFRPRKYDHAVLWVRQPRADGGDEWT